MKKLYILIFSFLYFSVFSQNPLLLNKNWMIEKVVISGNSILSPAGETKYFTKFQPTNSFSYYSNLCGEYFGNITYANNSNEFTITKANAAAGNCADNSTLDFRNNFALFFSKNSSVVNKVVYDIGTTNTGYNLTLTNVTGDQIVYIFHTPAAALSSTKWAISALKINGINYTKPSQYAGGDTTLDSTGFFQTSYFNSGQGNVGFYPDNRFRLLNLSVTLADSFDPEVLNFDGLYFDNFFSGIDGRLLPYSYSLTNADQTLIVTKHNGDTATYSKKILAISETSKQKISVYPNPATEFLNIEDVQPNAALELLDSSGKSVKSVSGIKNMKTQIDVKNLPSGIYYLKVDGQYIQTIIKK